MKNENNEIVSMDYPDGSTHQVSFNEFYQIRIGDRDCYIARYVDHTLNANMITLISYDNGQWYKIPLNTDSYGYLNDYVDNHLNEALDASLYTLADHIRVTLPMEIGFVPVNSRISSNNGKPSLKPVFKISYYERIRN